MLELKNLRVTYGHVTAIWDVSLSVGNGELVAVVGPNGAGKTSMINAVSGIVPAASGSIRFLDKNLLKVPAHHRAALGLSQCPEGRGLFTDMTVEENLRLGAYTCGRRAEVAARLEQVFEIFLRLRERRTQLTGTLSGGEQQMVALGRALMARPRLLMLDEPSLGLAPKVVLEVFRAIQQIRSGGTPVLIVEQNVHQTLEIADRGYVLENGRIALSGSGSELLNHDHIRTAYLGIG